MPTTRSIPVWVALLGSALAGVLVAGQSRITGGLGRALDNGVLAAAVSFSGGLLIMAVVMLLSPRGRGGLRALSADVRGRRFPRWALLGGAGGAFFVLSQGLAAGILGVAMFTVGIVAGQILSGIIIDRIGIGPAGVVRPDASRIIGAALAVIAVIVTVWSGISGDATLVLLVLPVLAGAGVAWQSAVNGLVRAAAESAITATFLNFVVGATILVIAALIWTGITGWPEAWPSNPVLYLGGPLGCIFIAAAAMFVRAAGVLLLSMANVAGQLIGALLIDLALPVAGGVTAGMVAGVAIGLLAVGIASARALRGGA